LFNKHPGNPLRHRRRYSTQTLDKKKRSSASAAPVKSRPVKKDRKYFRYIFIFILAAVFLKEKITANKAVAICMAVSGALLTIFT